MARTKNGYDYVMERVEPGGQTAERRPLEQQWFGDLAYYAGNTHFLSQDGTIRRPRKLGRKSRYSANLILPAVQRSIARIVQTNMDFRVAPKTAAFEDRQASKVSEKVWEHLRELDRFRLKFIVNTGWSAICGLGWYKVRWDPEAGEPERVYYDINGRPIPFGNHQAQRDAADSGRWKDYRPGDVAIDVVSPFQMFWDWNARELGLLQARWACQVSSTPIDDLADRYGSDIKTKVKPDDSDAGSIRYQEAISTMTANVFGVTLGVPQQTYRNNARTLDFYEKPSREYPKGRNILIAGGYPIKDGDNMSAELGNPLPFVMQPWWMMPGRFAPLGLVEQLRNPQRAYNRSRTHQLDVERTNGYPVTIMPRDAGVNVNRQMQSFPGLILEVNSQSAPFIKHLPPPSLPPYVGENADRARGELNTISANSDSRESFPAQVRGSLGIQALQEEKFAVLSPTSEMTAFTVLEVGRMALNIAEKMYDSPRLIRTMGRGNDFEVEYFSGESIRGNTDLRLFGEPGRLETSTASQERIMQMIEIGAVDPQNDPVARVAVLKAIDSKTADELLEDKMADEIQEEKFLSRMIKTPGFKPQLIGMEDPFVRVKVHERVMKRDEFFEFPDATQQAILARWQELKQVIEQTLAAQLEQQMMLSGSQSSQKGTPSAPKRQAANA